jgi:hypothetical protein
MKHFIQALQDANDKFVYPVKGTDSYREFNTFIDQFKYDVEHSLRRQFLNEEVHTPLRLSSVGKTPAFELLAKKLDLLPMGSKRTVPEPLRLIFTLGDWYESYLLFTLKRIGYEIVSTQNEVSWRGIKGHIDAIVKDPDGETHLIEVKSANDWYHTSCLKRGYPLDDRGYLTQLLTYSAALDIPHSRTHWIMWNKNTGTTSVFNLIDVPSEVATPRLIRAESIANAYHKCKTEEDLYSSVKPPPPKIEKTKDGRYVLDSEGKLKLYSPPEVSHPSFCYTLTMGRTKWGKAREYVLDYNYPDEFQQYKPRNITQDAIRADEVL